VKHQIAFVGGQIIPIFWGIYEKNPDVIHLLHTKDSRRQVAIISNVFRGKKIISHQIDPYQVEDIKSQVEEIVLNNEKDDFELNLTGGTKLMALAGQSIFNTLGLNSFYVKQNSEIYNFIDRSTTKINSKLEIRSFIQLSGHNKYSSQMFSDISNSELELSKKILKISGTSFFQNLMGIVRKENVDPKNCRELTHAKKGVRLYWKLPHLKLENNGEVIECRSKKAFEIVFNGIWWENVVADSIKNWGKIYELGLGVEVFSKEKEGNAKNEIDIVVNTGQKLIFIECKSGNVKQEDINKIRAVKRLYGGVASKSILVCRYKPRPDIIEKCQDLGIAVFYDRNLSKLSRKLDHLLYEMEL